MSAASAELREQMRAAVEHLWDGVDTISPNFEKALRRAAAAKTTNEKDAA